MLRRPARSLPADGPFVPYRDANFHESPGTQTEDPGRAVGFCRRTADRERLVAAQAGHDVRGPEAACRERRADLRRRRARSAVGWFRLSALAGSQLPAGPRRHLCQPEPGAPFRLAYRRHRRGADSLAARRRALFRCAKGQPDQLRRTGPPAASHQFRQSDAALSRGEDRARTRRPEPQGPDDPGARPDHAARQGPAGVDRVTAAHRQDGDAAKHCPCTGEEPSRGLPDRPVD